MSGLPPGVLQQIILQMIAQAQAGGAGNAPPLGMGPPAQQPQGAPGMGAPGALPPGFNMPMAGGPMQQMPVGTQGQISPQMLAQMLAPPGAAGAMPGGAAGGGPAMPGAAANASMQGALPAGMTLGTGNVPAGTMPTTGATPGRMPSMKKGGKVRKTGPHLLHKGERVIPAEKVRKEEKMRARRPSLRRRRVPAAALPNLPLRPMVRPAGAIPAGGALGAPGAMPAMKKGGKAKKSGPHMLHKGERVVPAKRARDMGAAAKRGNFPDRKSKRKK